MKLTIEEERMSDEFKKFHLRGLPFDAVIHHFTDTDKDNAHDHPFGFRSIILQGSYKEEVYTVNVDGTYSSEVIHRKKGDSFFIPAKHIHRIIELPEGECFTLILPEKWEKHTYFWKFEDKVQRRRWDELEYKDY